MVPVAPLGAFTSLAAEIIDQNFRNVGLFLGTGNVYYLNPSAGNDSYDGLTPQSAKRSLISAYNKTVSGKNDVVVLVGDGSTSATARIDAAFTWANSATHLIGVCSDVPVSQRARMAPSSGTTAFANFFTVSGSGCQFSNLQWFDGFGTGTTAQIAMTITGSRNSFVNCHIAGMGDTTSAADAGSRSVKISGGGENAFIGGAIGVDTVTRAAANASVEFAAATTRNVFNGVLFPFFTSSATVLGVITSASGAMDRFQQFDGCSFLNAVESTSTAMTALCTLAASSGGLLHFKDCSLVGITDFGSAATSLNQIRVMGASGTAATTGIAIIPS